MTDECSKRTESEEASGPGAFVAPKLSNASKISPLNGIEKVTDSSGRWILGGCFGGCGSSLVSIASG
jgi:hypothetical protein